MSDGPGRQWGRELGPAPGSRVPAACIGRERQPGVRAGWTEPGCPGRSYAGGRRARTIPERPRLFSPLDPFADASKGDDLLPAGTEDYIHIRIQQRNGRKTLTTVQGIADDYDKKKLVKAFKKVGVGDAGGRGDPQTQGPAAGADRRAWLLCACRNLPAMGRSLSIQNMEK